MLLSIIFCSLTALCLTTKIHQPVNGITNTDKAVLAIGTGGVVLGSVGLAYHLGAFESKQKTRERFEKRLGQIEEQIIKEKSKAVDALEKEKNKIKEKLHQAEENSE